MFYTHTYIHSHMYNYIYIIYNYRYNHWSHQLRVQSLSAKPKFNFLSFLLPKYNLHMFSYVCVCVCWQMATANFCWSAVFFAPGKQQQQLPLSTSPSTNLSWFVYICIESAAFFSVSSFALCLLTHLMCSTLKYTHQHTHTHTLATNTSASCFREV